jgi:hypothetical protein
MQKYYHICSQLLYTRYDHFIGTAFYGERISTSQLCYQLLEKADAKVLPYMQSVI